MTNVNATVKQIAPVGGAGNDGLKLGWLDSVDKAAQNDTVTITNARVVEWAGLTTDADGVADPVTISGNVMTLTSATATAASGLVLYK